MNGAAKLEAEAVLVRKKLQQAAWIETHGTDGQRKRFARGLLPESEILLGMSNTVFGFLNDFNLFLKLTDDEVIKNENEDNDIDPTEWEACQYKSIEASNATDDEYNKLEIIELTVRSEYPNTRVSLFDNYGGLEESNSLTTMRKSILVQVKVGEIVFSRHFACP